MDRGVYILCLLCPPRVHGCQCCCKNRCKSETNFKVALKLIKEYLRILLYQRLTAAKSRKSKEGRDDEDGEGNTYCELALLPKRSEFKHSKPKCPITRVQKKNYCRKDNLLLQWLGRFPSRAKKIDVVSRYFDSY